MRRSNDMGISLLRFLFGSDTGSELGRSGARHLTSSLGWSRLGCWGVPGKIGIGSVLLDLLLRAVLLGASYVDCLLETKVLAGLKEGSWRLGGFDSRNGCPWGVEEVLSYSVKWVIGWRSCCKNAYVCDQ